jgi:uncharacterized membrane protein
MKSYITAYIATGLAFLALDAVWLSLMNRLLYQPNLAPLLLGSFRPVLGLVAYATYDLTNQATLKTWPGIVTVADVCWGIVATSAASLIGFAVTRMIARI